MGRFLAKFDWVLLGALLPILLWSLLTLKAIGSAEDYFFMRQIAWMGVSIVAMAVVSVIDWRIFSSSAVIVGIYLVILVTLGVLLIVGIQVKGSTSWLNLYLGSFQPSEAVKLVLILVLAKYFSRRHIDIAHFRHIVISGLYAAVPVLLILLQPDLGSSLIVIAIWFGMTLVSGIKMRHLIFLLTVGIAISLASWVYLLEPYQKDRILTFLNPSFDPKGAGYNVIQSMIAVGSGELMGKGVGYGSQSRLQFLPESHTDFIFAAFAEEWGFVGVVLLLIFLGIVLWRILRIGMRSPSNFTKLFSIGFAIMVVVQIVIHAGMNMGLLPVTGITFPFLSYGGSSLMILFVGLGILNNIYSHRYVDSSRDMTDGELV